MSAVHIKIRKGLDLPITGAPKQEISAAQSASHVALLGGDYHGMKPSMLVKVGDRVKLGQAVFEDKKSAGVHYVAPAAGEVVAVHRGARRVFDSLVIRVDGDDAETFELAGGKSLESASREDVRALLVAAGQWPALRTRPYSKVPGLEDSPAAIFVTAIETNPLGAKPEVVLAERDQDFRQGLIALTKLTDGTVHLCTAPGTSIPGADIAGVEHAIFEGPHPAGLAGTHIHFLRPVGTAKRVWTIGYQDVAAWGALLRTGKIDVERVVSIAGPAASNPRLVRSRLGAQLSDICQGEIADASLETRIISGSVFQGHTASGPRAERFGFLGRYACQVSLLREGRKRDFLGWHMPGTKRFSIKKVFASALSKGKKYDFNTNLMGSPRAMVPVGSYEAVMPLDILPTQLLRALLSGDTDSAQALGALELDEEDLGLCTFVDPGKTDFGPLLRESLTMIERDG